jgi:alpha,alpha-trehalose phosphorylase (configuration-retaining)
MASSPLTPSSRTRSQSAAILQETFIGVSVDYAWPPRFAFYVFDGYFCWDFKDFQYSEEPVVSDAQVNTEELHKAIVEEISIYAQTHNMKVIMAGLALNGDKTIKKLGHLLWKSIDVLPCIVLAEGSSLDEISCSAARKTTNFLSASSLPGLPRVLVGFRHEVEVDAKQAIEFTGLDSYKLSCAPNSWKQIVRLAARVRQSNLTIVFINSTPQGGGVAILRHSMVRFLRLLGVNVHWFVMRPSPEVFDITKKKFHNILQGVAPDGTRLLDKEGDLWSKWCENNIRLYWKDGPLMSADMVVIDDPQPCGIIPHLRQMNPKAKIVYRSHIEIRTELTDREGTEPFHVWNFLWQYIKGVDVFVSHPVTNFVPKTVHESKMKCYEIPASTDPIDGLNKPLDQFSIKYYQLLFNKMARDQIGCELNFSRPYFIQICRFDPSKGIPDLINAYIEFRASLDEDITVVLEDIPQLVITGHGSIDDPEGTMIYNQVMALTETDLALPYQSDIILVRLGPSDQILNALLRGALCAFQLSIREGFEIKVTESLLKGVPVVAYDRGGIPLQIRHGVDGYLLPAGSIDKVSAIMKQMASDPNLRKRLSRPDICRDWLMTPSNAGRWMSILLGEDPIN